MRDKEKFIEFYEKFKNNPNRVLHSHEKLSLRMRISNWGGSILSRFAPISYTSYERIPPFGFAIEAEDLEYFYNKYKPKVEQWRCEQAELKVLTVSKEIASKRKELEELIDKQC